MLLMASIDPYRSSLAPRLASTFLATTLLLSAVAAPAVAQDPSVTAVESPAPAAASLPEGFTKKMVKQVADVIDSVHPVRQLPPAEGVSYRVIDDATFLEELQALFREEYPESYLEAEDAAFTRLGLLGPDDDLESLILKIYDQQVLAFYDPKTKTFTMIGPVNKIGPTESIVVAHEYDHALQDARWDLEGDRIKDLDRADAILAQQALIEGDATAVMNDWAARELKLADLLRVSAEALSKQDARRIGRLPDILQRQLEFPYIDGFAFVNAIRGRGDWAAVNDVWEAQPVSTEQILHPELYPDELPVEIELPDIATAIGPGWTESYQQTLGEMQIHVWVADGKKGFSLFPALPAQLPNAEAAAGWGGDRLVSLDGPDGAWAVVWQTDWDSQKDRVEFRQAALDAMKDLPGAKSVSNTAIVGGLSSPVLVLVADGEETMNALRAGLGL
jgi:predicted secreted protein